MEMDGSIESNSSNESIHTPILFSATNEANAASFHIIMGRLQRMYKETLCGLFIFRYIPKSPEQVWIESPSHIKPKWALTYKKNRYLYSLSDVMSKWQFELYGGDR